MREKAMKGWRRRSFLLGLCGAALVAGCNFPTAMYFLMPEAKEPPEYKRLASDNDKKEVRVVLWTYSALDMRTEFIQSDRQLTELLARQIDQMSRENQEKVKIVSPRKVEEYKNLHPDWKSLDPEQVGKYFKADYVINLEINQFSLYEPNAAEQLLRGRTHILVSVVDVNNPDDTPLPKEFSYTYPGEPRGGLDASEMHPIQFRNLFLEHAARRLAFYFVSHQKRDRVLVMDD
jgi:hypothetical protein